MAKPKPKQAKSSDAPSRAGDLEVLKQLLKLLDESSATVIKLQRGDSTFEVSRLGGLWPAAAAAHGNPPAAAGATGLAQAAPAAAPAPPAAAPPPSSLLEIKSPMVGTFYSAPEPGAEPYVRSGTRVTPGQTLCIIEAMKIMNEIESEVTGVLREVLVEDAQPVEFGQVLFRVEPHG